VSGWHILNARDAQWFENAELGCYANFERGERFPELGVNLVCAKPGQPIAMYHREPHQEGFLVLSGEAIAIVEGEERPLRAWDYLHCPAGVDHVVVAAGTRPCVLLAVGSRVGQKGVVYPVNEAALARGAGVTTETDSPREAYAPLPEDAETPFREDFLPR
jgi:uncharacterized cupin superfamily protein